MLKRTTYPIAAIRVPVKRVKTLDPAKVRALAEGIMADGQTTPISLRADGEGFVLIEGYNRLEALKALGEATADAFLVPARPSAADRLESPRRQAIRPNRRTAGTARPAGQACADAQRGRATQGADRTAESGDAAQLVCGCWCEAHSMLVSPSK